MEKTIYKIDYVNWDEIDLAIVQARKLFVDEQSDGYDGYNITILEVMSSFRGYYNGIKTIESLNILKEKISDGTIQ
jgi:hypothetical protein